MDYGRPIEKTTRFCKFSPIIPLSLVLLPIQTRFAKAQGPTHRISYRRARGGGNRRAQGKAGKANEVLLTTMATNKGASEAVLGSHQHGKSRVRVGRVWRLADGLNVFAEYSVNTVLKSAMEHAYVQGSNEGMTATDTQKNMCYYVAQQMKEPCSIEEYALALGRKFVSEYPLVSSAIIEVEQKPWKRVSVGGEAHNHGFAMTGTEIRFTRVQVDRASDKCDVLSGFRELRLCKTTQSGYEGFLHDQYTLLPDTRERLVASSVTATWRHVSPSTTSSFDASYDAVKAQLVDTFFGNPKSGTYSPSVQKTLYEMGEAVIVSCPGVEWIKLNMPNLHFNPLNPVTSKFDNDVYFPTSEPHGTIEAVVQRKQRPRL